MVAMDVSGHTHRSVANRDLISDVCVASRGSPRVERACPVTTDWPCRLPKDQRCNPLLLVCYDCIIITMRSLWVGSLRGDSLSLQSDLRAIFSRCATCPAFPATLYCHLYFTQGPSR